MRSDAAVALSVPRYELEQITVPTLVIAAEDDLFGTFKGGQYMPNTLLALASSVIPLEGTSSLATATTFGVSWLSF